MLGLLLLIGADLSSPMPGAFSWESSSLFVDAVVPGAVLRMAAPPAFVASGRQSFEAHGPLRSGVSAPVVRAAFIRGALRPHIKRAQSALVPPSPSEDH